MKRTPILLAVASLIVGCSTIPPDTVTVQVPVAVACDVQMPARPSMDTDRLPLGAKPDVQARAMRAEIERREAYEGELRAGLQACIAPIPVQLQPADPARPPG